MKDAKTIFMKVLRDVLEQFAFMFSDSNGEGRSSICREPCVHVSMGFSGSCKGMISLTAPQSLCGELAGNILGVDPDEVGQEDGSDALKELANVVCGKLLSELFGDKKVFDLDVPVSEPVDTAEWETLAEDPASIQLWVEERPMLAKLVL